MVKEAIFTAEIKPVSEKGNIRKNGCSKDMGENAVTGDAKWINSNFSRAFIC
jgi:hypothetical protein